MDWPRLIVIVLYAVGLVLPVLGAALALRNASQTLERRELAIEEWHSIDADERAALIDALGPVAGISTPPGIDTENGRKADVVREPFDRRKTALKITPMGTTGQFGTLAERAAVAALHLVAKGNVGNALLVGLGLVCGTVASIVALYLPPPT